MGTRSPRNLHYVKSDLRMLPLRGAPAHPELVEGRGNAGLSTTRVATVRSWLRARARTTVMQRPPGESAGVRTGLGLVITESWSWEHGPRTPASGHRLCPATATLAF